MKTKFDCGKAAGCATVAAMLLVIGCNREVDEPVMPAERPLSPAPLPIPAPSPEPAETTPPPPQPAPDPRAENDPPTPMPGQANDHSNPAFKDGGQPDPQD